jgi:putative SOS response-associated peptidase YedK
MPVITNKNRSEFSFFQWGFIPNWSLNDSVALNLINARAETIFTKAPFKESIKSKRCLIPADGFFEWKKEGKAKVPYRITLNSDEAFSLAGIWDSWERPSDGEIINTFTIITTSANRLVNELHDRMPVILPKPIEEHWLDDRLKENDLVDLMRPFDADQMHMYKVNKIVNSVQYNIPECIQVAPKIYPGESFSLFD